MQINLIFDHSMIGRSSAHRKKSATSQCNNNTIKPFMVVPSVDNLKKIIQQLQKSVEDERYKRQEVEEKLLEFRQRSIQRQKEFFRLIERLGNRDKKKSLDGEEIQRLYQQILYNFETTNHETNRFLEKKYDNLNQTMERKINKILDVMKQEVGKNIRISKQSTQAIKKELQETVRQAKIVEENNIQFMKIKCKIEDQNQILVEEKNLLIQEIVEKKKRLNQQAEQIKFLKQLLQEANQSSSSLQSSSRANSIQNQNLTFSQQISHQQTPNIPLPFAKTFWFKRNAPKKPSTIIQKDLKLDLDMPSTNLLSNQKKTSKMFQKGINMSSTNYNTISLMANPNRSHKRAKSQFFSQRHNSSFSKRKNPQQYMSNLQIESKKIIKCPHCMKQFKMEVIQGYERTISHLQKMLRRQKDRAKAYGDSATQITLKHQDINETLAKIIEDSSKAPSEQKLEALLKSQRLFKTLKLLKKRLQMLESPTVSCGWTATQDFL